MKILASIILITNISFLIGGCEASNASENLTADTASVIENTKSPSGNAKREMQLKNDDLNAVFEHYQRLTIALTNADPTQAKIASNAIYAGMREVQGAARVAAAANEITNAKNLQVQRSAYSNLSDGLIALVKQTGLASGELYVDFCPMALNDKGGYWLTTNNQIRNPYFGAEMLTCGEIKETIK